MTDDELRDRLRAADPAHDLPPTDPARAELLLQDVMATELTSENRATGTRGRGPLTWLVAAAAVLVIVGAGVVGALTLTGDDSPPVASPEPGSSSSAARPSAPAAALTQLTAPAGAAYAAKCLVPTAEVLATADVAFDGTVSTIDGDRVVLRVNHWYAGSPTESVEVTAPDADLGRLITTVDFVAGSRYLVSAVDGQVSICGFSAPYDAELAALYEQAFGG